MIRTIFFDFGNVVAFFDHQRALDILRHYSDVNPTELGLILYASTLEADYEIGRISTAEYIAAARADGRLRCTDAEFIAAFTAIFRSNPLITPILQRLKPRYRLVLASNTNDAHFSHYREQFREELSCFDHLVVSHEARSRKPHPNFYTYCQKHAGCLPEECLFIDDMPTNIAAAKAFGWHGVVYTEGMDLVEALRSNGVEI